ncbi:MAG: hypothetical protein HY927_06895 [Elusimicrobia bacterium]|nr:hypothetical protein [Elusimicrobiota bacterium]
MMAQRPNEGSSDTPERVLLKAGLIGERQAREALDRVSAMPRRRREVPGRCLPQAVVDLGMAGKRAVLEALAEAWGLPFEEDVKARVDPAFLGEPLFKGYVSFKEAARRGWLPLGVEDGDLILACAGPVDPLLLEDLGFRVPPGAKVRPVLALAREIDAVLDSVDPEERRIGPGSVAREWEKEGR